ncbi:MAG: exodeoxyribonuclease III [Gammaproteobacteria bacterium]|nr:exodeoxyribonuclease III [Gammaproteobacteria bacterium]
MRIISVNTNGIRAAARKGFFDWLKVIDADVICIQETKAQVDQLSDPIFSPEGYHVSFHDAQKKGYSGVAVYSKQKPNNIQSGIGWDDMDSEGRYLQVDFDNVSVISLYLPSGSAKEERQDFKYDLMYRFTPKLKEMLSHDREYIICGDWNIAHKVIDIKNAKPNEKNSGFLPEERAWMDVIFDELGWVDAFRVVNQEAHQYTWWSNRGQAWANNTGWRIDYQIITPGLKDRVKSTSIYKEERFSDHAPLIVDYSGDL